MTRYDPQRHHRRSIRLIGYDYTQQGAYYVTIVAWRRVCLFGEVVDGGTPQGDHVVLNRYGDFVQKWWEEIPRHFPNVETGAFIIMPNHVHGIIFIVERRGTGTMPDEEGINKIMDENDDESKILGGETPPLRAPTLGQIVAYFKYQSTKEMNLVDNSGTVTKFWQRNYYEHVIRDEKDLQNKTDYINANPLLWDQDDDNPLNGDQ